MDDYIVIDNVYKTFEDNEVLRGVSLALEKNESIVVIGRSGSGKSVLLKHLNGLLSPDSGTIVIDGQDITQLKTRGMSRVREKMGMLFQSAALLDSLTVAENVGLALKESRHLTRNEIKEIVEEKLEMVGLAGTSELYPSDLSGGMRKRVGLARAISTSPEILLYDEPTTGLDPITADMINDLIIELHDKLKVTSISVTHDMTSAYKIGERIVMLYDGRVEYDGSPEEIRKTDNAVVRQFINGQAVGPIKIR
jgi:phospholipid/cholesterol/gamma-HCH transport system ATP-binding protein